MTDKPTCGNDTLLQKAYHIPLKAGKYELSAKDESGNVKFSATVKIFSNRMSSSGGIGGMEMASQGECITIGFVE
ncbi:MAG: hypothetical protein H0X62_09760 [Bacteroidetes bacterium]|nr:hypothetical protein [Bacteroidota bacterium]